MDSAEYDQTSVLLLPSVIVRTVHACRLVHWLAVLSIGLVVLSESLLV